MNITPAFIVSAFAFWAILLVAGIGCFRIYCVLSGKKKSSEFPASVQHGPELYWRLNRAHLNTLENLPIFIGLVWGSYEVGVSEIDLLTPCLIILFGRIFQTIFHIAGGNEPFITLRFIGFLTQVLTFIWIFYLILGQVFNS